MVWSLVEDGIKLEYVFSENIIKAILRDASAKEFKFELNQDSKEFSTGVTSNTFPILYFTIEVDFEKRSIIVKFMESISGPKPIIWGWKVQYSKY